MVGQTETTIHGKETYGSVDSTGEEQALLRNDSHTSVKKNTTTGPSVRTSIRSTTITEHESSSLSGAANGAAGVNVDENNEGNTRQALLFGLSMSRQKFRKVAIDLSLCANIIILLAKLVAYLRTFSLSVLAALVDSILDVISQLVLSFTEHKSARQHGRSSALYPAGAARLEPIGVLTCAALMGMASFEVIKESMGSLIFDRDVIVGDHLSSVWSMIVVVLVKVALLYLCKKAGQGTGKGGTSSSSSGGEGLRSSKAVVVVADPTLEALAQDHLNDALSNAVAAVSFLTALWNASLWYFDPLGAIVISIYIIYSWYATGKEQIEQLTGKAAPDDFVDELYQMASSHDSRLIVDVCRAYHFGPKFLVELEVVLPRETPLVESHDIGMDLQYEIEAREEVERCFVHIDYERRGYDEHVVSKDPELMKMYKPDSWYSRSVTV